MFHFSGRSDRCILFVHKSQSVFCDKCCLCKILAMFPQNDVLFWGIVWSGFLKRGIAHYGLNFITISTCDNPLYGHIASEPGYLAAYNRLKPLYPEVLLNSTWHSFYYPGGNILCADAAVQMEFIAGDIYSLLKNISGLTILLSTGCSLEMIVLGDFAREWDVSLFSSTSGDSRLANKVRFPTVISGTGGADHTSMAWAAKTLLDKYQWRTLTLLFDLASQYPGLNTFFSVSYSNFKALLQEHLGAYTIYTFRFDSGGQDHDIDNMLEKTRRQSRIIFLFTHPKVLRDILVRAFHRGMADGSYVFMASMLPTAPTRGPITWKYLDNDDKAAFEAFRSLIVFQTTEPAWSEIKDWIADIESTVRLHYNVTLTADQSVNEFAISSYEILYAITEVLNRSDLLSNSVNILDRRTLTKRLWNSSLALPSRDFTISPNGMRMTNIPFSRLDVNTGEMQIAWRYLSANASLMSVTSLTEQWKGGRPPPDRPLCGYTGDLCHVVSTTNSAVILTLLLMCSICAVVLWERIRSRRMRDNTKWWLVDQNYFRLIAYCPPACSNFLRSLRQLDQLISQSVSVSKFA